MWLFMIGTYVGILTVSSISFCLNTVFLFLLSLYPNFECQAQCLSLALMFVCYLLKYLPSATEVDSTEKKSTGLSPSIFSAVDFVALHLVSDRRRVCCLSSFPLLFEPTLSGHG